MPFFIYDGRSRKIFPNGGTIRVEAWSEEQQNKAKILVYRGGQLVEEPLIPGGLGPSIKLRSPLKRVSHRRRAESSDAETENYCRQHKVKKTVKVQDQASESPPLDKSAKESAKESAKLLSGKTPLRGHVLQENQDASRQNENRKSCNESKVDKIVKSTELKKNGSKVDKIVKSTELKKNGSNESKDVTDKRISRERETHTVSQRHMSESTEKELYIPAEDIAVAIDFIVTNSNNQTYLQLIDLANVDVERIIVDDIYAACVFYKINPRVMVERIHTENIVEILSRCRVADFAKQLGLRSIKSSRQAKESEAPVADKRRSKPVIVESTSSEDSAFQMKSVNVNPAASTDSSDAEFNADLKSRMQKKMVTSSPKNISKRRQEQTRSETRSPLKLLRPINTPRRSNIAHGTAYSTKEDHAIVAWLSASPKRERLVSGNKIWQELQEEFRRLTGVERSWHSLRNRYLRYILPHLEQMALPSQDAQRLRANFATGDPFQKKKMKSDPRNNSIFVLPTVRSAYAALKLRKSSSMHHESPAAALPNTSTAGAKGAVKRRRLYNQNAHL